MSQGVTVLVGNSAREKIQPSKAQRSAQEHLRNLIFSTFLIIVISIVMGESLSFADAKVRKHITIYGASPLLHRYPTQIANQYNLIITEWRNNDDCLAIKRINPAATIIFYRDLLGVLPDYDDWKTVANHPDWFVRDSKTGNRTKHVEFKWYLMDITNTEYRQHLLQYIQNKLQKYPVFDGIFLDDTFAMVNPRRFFIEESPKETPTFTPQFMQGYRSGVIAFLKDLKVILKNKLIIINTDDDSDYLQYADGMMFEGFVYGSWQGADYHPPINVWQSHMERLQKLMRNQEKWILVHSGSKGTGEALYKQFMFSFSSYLLFASPRSSLFFDGPHSRQSLSPFKEYYMDIGAPKEDYILKPLTWQRKLSDEFCTNDKWQVNGEKSAKFHENGAGCGIAFNSSKESGSYLSKCINIEDASTIKLTAIAKGLDVTAGDNTWQRFGLLGNFRDKNMKLITGGIDLPFDIGSYDWKRFQTSYTIPQNGHFFCINLLGFHPKAKGTGWIKSLNIESMRKMTTLPVRRFENATVFLNPSKENVTIFCSEPKQETGITIGHQSGFICKDDPCLACSKWEQKR